MPTCAKCNNWVSSFDDICPSCGHSFDKLKSKDKLTSTAKRTSLRTAARPSLDGFVYLIKSEKYFKIGKTNSFKRRYKEIKLQLPFDVVEIHKIQSNNIDLCEIHWHRHFSRKRTNGEWFQLNDADVSEFVAFQSMTYK